MGTATFILDQHHQPGSCEQGGQTSDGTKATPESPYEDPLKKQSEGQQTQRGKHLCYGVMHDGPADVIE